MSNTRILVVGDAHVDEHKNNNRFEWLGGMIVDRLPEHIVLMGDFLTFNCFSNWDMNKRALMEGRRYALEIASGNQALDLMLSQIITLNKSLAKRRKAKYNPHIHYLMGNHEDRLDRYLMDKPEIQGTMSVQKDLKLDERNIQVTAYKKYHYINGIGFTHVPFNKAKAISGNDITRKAQMVTIKSCVFGHTHELHTSNRHTEGMDSLQQTLNVGCFFEENEEYVAGLLTQYWKGVVLLTSYKPGRFDMETISMGRLKRMYG
jgi:hypothetical protein